MYDDRLNIAEVRRHKAMEDAIRVQTMIDSKDDLIKTAEKIEKYYKNGAGEE